MNNTIEKTDGGRKGFCSFWLIALIVALPILVYSLLTAAGALLIVGDPLRKSDVVVLLGGGDRQRLEEALKVYMDRDASLMVLTETGEIDPDTGEAYSRIIQMEMLEMGMPMGGMVFTEEHGNSTYEEAVAVRDFLTKNKAVLSAIIVTDPYHTMRTRLIYREVFADSDIRVSVRPVRGHWYRSNTWWRSRAGWEATITEYIKLFAFLAGVRTG